MSAAPAGFDIAGFLCAALPNRSMELTRIPTHVVVVAWISVSENNDPLAETMSPPSSALSLSRCLAVALPLLLTSCFPGSSASDSSAGVTDSTSYDSSGTAAGDDVAPSSRGRMTMAEQAGRLAQSSGEMTSSPSSSARDVKLNDKPPGGQSLPPLVWSAWRTSNEVPGIRFRYRREISTYDGGWTNDAIPSLGLNGRSAGYRWGIQVENNTSETLNIWKNLKAYSYSTYHNDGNFAAEKGPVIELWFPIIRNVEPGTTGERSFADMRYDL